MGGEIKYTTTVPTTNVAQPSGAPLEVGNVVFGQQAIPSAGLNAWPGPYVNTPILPSVFVPAQPVPNGSIQKFTTGASRDADHDKYDYEGFLCPLVLERFAAYMHKNRKMADGSLRESDNWQKGIPFPKYMKSLWRHTKEVWKLHRGYRTYDERGNEVFMEDALCGVLFNTMGYLHEWLKAKQTPRAGIGG